MATDQGKHLVISEDLIKNHVYVRKDIKWILILLSQGNEHYAIANATNRT